MSYCFWDIKRKASKSPGWCSNMKSTGDVFDVSEGKNFGRRATFALKGSNSLHAHMYVQDVHSMAQDHPITQLPERTQVWRWERWVWGYSHLLLLRHWHVFNHFRWTLNQRRLKMANWLTSTLSRKRRSNRGMPSLHQSTRLLESSSKQRYLIRVHEITEAYSIYTCN